MFAVQADGADIITIEGIANADGTLSALQEGFRDDARAAMRLLHAGHDHRAPSGCCRRTRTRREEEIRMGISGNICRCTGYQNIVKAIQYAAAKINGVEFQEAAE